MTRLYSNEKSFGNLHGVEYALSRWKCIFI